MATPSVYIGNILSLILTLPRFDGKKIRSKFNNEKRRMEKSSFILYFVLKNFNSVRRLYIIRNNSEVWKEFKG